LLKFPHSFKLIPALQDFRPSGMISVVMPAYNEAEHIIDNLEETIRTLNELEFQIEISIVDDGSPDNTCAAAIRQLHRYDENVRIIRYSENRGKGCALVCGTWYARGDYIVFLDADMDLHPSQLPTFFGIMEATRADVVIGSKLHPASRVNYPFKRRLWSLAYYSFVRLLFGLPVRDTQTGLKVFRAEVLRRVFPKVLVKRFAFDIEVLAISNSLGYRISESPVVLHFTRRFGRVNLRDVFQIFWSTLAIFYRLHILHYYQTVEGDWREPDFPCDVHVGTLTGFRT